MAQTNKSKLLALQKALNKTKEIKFSGLNKNHPSYQFSYHSYCLNSIVVDILKWHKQ